MPDFKEYFLQHIWRYQLFDKNNLTTTDGKPLFIIKNGFLNTNSGPDFQYAHVKIDYIDWYGNIEIHIKSSDWFKHNHENDTNYNNVVLHVVWQHDLQTSHLPVLELKGKISEHYIVNFKNLISTQNTILCKDYISKIPSIYINQMLDKVLLEKVESKSSNILRVLQQYNSDWEQTFYHFLVRNFGFKVNSEEFEELACKLPYKIIQKHKDNLFQIESLLFGVAGLLTEEVECEYYKKLKKEFDFLSSKYGLIIITKKVNFLRLRPPNFPTIRLAQLAAFLFNVDFLANIFLANISFQSLISLFRQEVNEYWDHHYVFGKNSAFHKCTMGQSSVELLVINTIIPIVITYKKAHGDDNLDETLNLLIQIQAEKNIILENWDSVGLKSKTSYDSQALIHLYEKYCVSKKCLDCTIGTQILKNANCFQS
ncbi:MAG: DUF2851 family protein [Cytophagales bacterium]